MSTTGVRLAQRLDGVSESATLKLNAMVQSLKAQGADVINLTAGEPDFNVQDAAKKAVLDAVAANRSRYTPAAGIPELREAIARKTNAQQPSVARSVPWRAADGVGTNGGKQAICNALLALVDPGDEVLIPSPYWLSYPEMVKIAGGVPKFIHGGFSQGFKITPDQLRAALAGSRRARMLVFNSPSNPTGAMYSREEYAALGEVLLKTPGAENVWILSDEIYDRIVFGRVPFCSFLESCPGLRDRLVTVNGMSKSGAMTGWRVGWSVAPEGLTQGLITLQGQSTSGINALAQWASVATLALPEENFAGQVATYRRRRDLALEILGKSRRIEPFTPDGAFYVFAGVEERDSMAFAERLLAEARVAVVPGTPFGEPGFVRLSVATDDRSLEQGCRRIVDYVER